MFCYKKISNFVPAAQLNRLGMLYESKFNDETSDFLYSNVIKISRREIKHNLDLMDIIARIEREIQSCTEFTIAFKQIWMVHSDPKIVDSEKLPYIPHFDAARTIKGMIYLQKVCSNSGPISIATTDLSNIEVARKNLTRDYRVSGENSIGLRELDYHQVIGEGGDVVIFDTNAPHFAGIPVVGFDRKVIRVDFDVPRLNPITLKSRCGKLAREIGRRFPNWINGLVDGIRKI